MKRTEYIKPRIESIRIGDMLASMGPARAFLYGGGGGRSDSPLTITTSGSNRGSGSFNKF